MLEQMFALRTRGATVSTEVLAGATTFMVMAYIIFVGLLTAPEKSGPSV